MSIRPCTTSVFALLLVAGCAATSNPSRGRLKPISPAMAEAVEPESAGAEEYLVAAGPELPEADPAGEEAAQESSAGDADAESTTEATTGTGPDAAPAEPATVQASACTVASVAGAAIGADELLERLWLRAPDGVRQELEQLVEARFVLAEALRLRIDVRPAEVEEEVGRTYAAIQEEMRERDVTLSVEEYVRRAIGVDPAFYNRLVRRQSITHLLAQRAIRIWSMSKERAEVSVLEVEDRVDADRIRAELDEGRSFDELSAELTAGDEPGGKRTRLQVVRSAQSALARVAFATHLGQVGGPLEEGGRLMFVAVEARHDPVEGDWEELGDRVQASLVRSPVQNPEYWQWKIAMQERYRVDRDPFLDLIGAERP